MIGSRHTHGLNPVVTQQAITWAMAAQTSGQRIRSIDPACARNRSESMSWILSKFATHSRSRPSDDPKWTSHGIPRILDVIGAARSLVSWGATHDRVSTNTGRILSTSKSTHQICPCPISAGTSQCARNAALLRESAHLRWHSSGVVEFVIRIARSSSHMKLWVSVIGETANRLCLTTSNERLQ